jgi:hypothetical protein
MHVEGRVLHRGAPQGDCQVLLVDEGAREVLAACETGADGRWALDGEGTLVFARCHGEALGVVSGRADGPLELELTDVAPTHRLTVRVAGLPDGLEPQLRLAPREIDAVDLRWLRAPVEGARSSMLAGVSDRQLARWVQAGRWWVTAALLMEASGGVPLPDSWLPVAAETDDGRELAADRDGFELEVDGPLTVTIRLEARPTETLDR